MVIIDSNMGRSSKYHLTINLYETESVGSVPEKLLLFSNKFKIEETKAVCKGKVPVLFRNETNRNV